MERLVLCVPECWPQAAVRHFGRFGAAVSLEQDTDTPWVEAAEAINLVGEALEREVGDTSWVIGHRPDVFHLHDVAEHCDTKVGTNPCFF